MLAQAFGVKGMVVNDPAELSEAIAQMLAHDGPVLMDVRVRRDENCYPMIPPNKSNDDMVGLPEKPRPLRAVRTESDSTENVQAKRV